MTCDFTDCREATIPGKAVCQKHADELARAFGFKSEADAARLDTAFTPDGRFVAPKRGDLW